MKVITMATPTVENKQSPESKTKPEAVRPEFELTHDEVYNASQRLIDAVDRWHKEEIQPVQFGGGTDIPITQSLDQAIRETCDATADQGKTVDPRAYARVMAFDSLANEYRKFLNRASQEDPFLPPSGTEEFWKAYEWLKKAHETVRLPKPPTVKDLRDNQKVSDNQIAIMYGWVDEEGYPETNKVLDEYEKPGTHSGKNWVHPSITRRLKNDAEDWAKRGISRSAFFLTARASDPVGSKPPSLDEMIRQNCPAKQISNVHKISEAEAMELLQEYRDQLTASNAGA